MKVQITFYHKGKYVTGKRDLSPGSILPLPYVDSEGKGRVKEWVVPESIGQENVDIPGVGVIAQIEAA